MHSVGVVFVARRKAYSGLVSSEEIPSVMPEAAPESAPEAAIEHHSVYCPNCSDRLYGHRCKLICRRCGYYLSCADYY